MAWDSNASPWDWDTGSVLLLGHGVDFNSRKHNHWLGEADSGSVKDGGSHHSAVLQNVSEMDSSSTVIQNGGATDYANLSCLEQHKPPADIPASISNECLPVIWNDQSACSNAKVVTAPKTAESNWKGLSEDNTGLPKLGSHSNHGFAQLKYEASEIKEKRSLSENKCLEGKLTFQPEQQGKLQGSTKGAGAASTTDERHSSTATGSVGSGESLIGLHLGKRTYFQDAGAARPSHKPNTGTKKQRANAAGSQPPRCQVDKCETDLTSAKDYHRRHKVCEAHSKAGKVMVANQEKRFCQQCSRFHVLSEFDEAKRSCRRRLAGHNERRRKPQIDTTILNSRLPSTFHDWPLLHQARYHGLSSLWQDSADMSSFRTWQRMLRTDQPAAYDCAMQTTGIDKQFYLKGFSPHSNDKLPLLLLQSPKGLLPNDASCQSAHHQYLSGYSVPVGSNLTLASSSGAGGFSGLETAPIMQAVKRVADSGCALSLLSLPTQESHASNAGSRDLYGRTNLTLDQLMVDDMAPQQMLHGRQLQHMEYAADKLLPVGSDSQNHLCSSSAAPACGMEQCEVSFMHVSNGMGGFDNHLCLATLQAQETRRSEDVKQTIDLMQGSSLQSQDVAPVQPQLVPFQLGSSTSADFQYNYGSSYF